MSRTAAAGASRPSSSQPASTSSQTNTSTSLQPFITLKLVETQKYYCPFLERGFCRHSARCHFSHDSHTATKIPTDFCHFYLANQCLYGQSCKFIHREPLVDSIDDELLNLANINLTDYNNDDNENQSNEIYIDSDNFDPEMVNIGYNYDDYHQIQMPSTLESSNRLSNDQSSRQTTLFREKIVASSSSSHDNNQYTANDDHQLNPSSTPPNSSSPTNLLPLRALVTADPKSSKDTKNTKLPTSRVIDAAKDGATTSTKAWQSGRILASLRGESSGNQSAQWRDLPLCPYSLASGGCPYPDGCCTYLHGQICDLCSMPCLHPYDEAQRLQHRDDCLHEHEREMELSFAVQRSKDKICGICMDTIVEKKPITSSRFGILEKCNHIFCLDCIRKWRGTKQFDSKTIRACPECRVNSDFVVPSKYWVEDQDDKEKLIHDYKAALRSKPCRYFNEGKGDCPFAGSCFYKHAYPDGRLAEMEAPKPRRRLYGARGSTTLANYVLWSLIRSFDEDDWSDNDESESRYYIEDDDDYEVEEDEDEEEDEEEGEVDDDEAIAEIADYTSHVW